jgi:hypothetical protein
MAQRTKEQLLAEIKTRGIEFNYDATYQAVAAILGESAAKAALIKKMIELVPSQAQVETRDWASEFLADNKRAAAIASLRKAATQVSEMLATIKADGSKLHISVNLTANAEEIVKLDNKKRNPRENQNRNYNDLGAKLLADEIATVYFKPYAQHELIACNVRAGEKTDTNLSGCEVFISGTWNPVVVLPSKIKAFYQKAKDEGHRKAATFDLWREVRVGNVKGSMNLDAFMDSSADEDEEDSE